MKFCTKCGNELMDEAVICPKCGCIYNNQNLVNNSETDTANGVAIVGFIFSFLLPIVGFICGLFGLSKSNELNGKGYGLSIAAIILSVIFQIFGIIQAIAILTN